MAELTITGGPGEDRHGAADLGRSRTTSTGAVTSIYRPAEELTTGSFALDDEARPAAGKGSSS